MGAQLGGKGSFSDINMTPLIDIVLVVLIIMMVNIPIQVEQMGVKLPAIPAPPSPPPDPNAEQLAVSMYEDGTIALNRTLMDRDRLFQELTLRLRSMSKKVVFVDAALKLKYGAVIDIVDLAKEAGAEKVSFAKVKPEGPTSANAVADGALPRGARFGSPAVGKSADGGQWMTEKQADTAIQPLGGLINGCWSQTLATNPTAAGKFLLQVDVGPKGQILGQRIASDTVGDAALQACVLSLVPQLSFEPLGEDRTCVVQYPIFFSHG